MTSLLTHIINDNAGMDQNDIDINNDLEVNDGYILSETQANEIIQATQQEEHTDDK